MTFMYLNNDRRETDYFLTEAATPDVDSVEVDLSEEFLDRYKEAVDNYDGIQAELDLMYRGKVGL